MGKNTLYTGKVGLAEALEVALLGSSAKILKLDFLGSAGQEASAPAPEFTHAAPQ